MQSGIFSDFFFRDGVQVHPAMQLVVGDTQGYVLYLAWPNSPAHHRFIRLLKPTTKNMYNSRLFQDHVKPNAKNGYQISMSDTWKEAGTKDSIAIVIAIAATIMMMRKKKKEKKKEE